MILLRRRPFTAPACLVVGLALAFLSGCNSDRQETAPVRGKITYQGKPLPRGTIMFVPDKPGPAATGEIQKDGTYVLSSYGKKDGAVLGTHTVTITARGDEWVGSDERASAPRVSLPEKYAYGPKSGLTAEVKNQDNEINFDLK